MVFYHPFATAANSFNSFCDIRISENLNWASKHASFLCYNNCYKIICCENPTTFASPLLSWRAVTGKLEIVPCLEVKTRCFSCFYYTKVKDLKGLFKLVYVMVIGLSGVQFRE